MNSYSGQTGCRNVQDDGEETSYLTRTDVCSLFVTYNPDLGEFHEALLRATDGSRYIVIVDNTTNPATQVAIESLIKDVSKRLQQCGAHIDFHLLTLGENRGLSTAYNNGIAKARELKARFILLLDQDSLLAPGAIGSLVKRWIQMGDRVRIGAISCTNIEEVNVNVGLEPIVSKLAAYRGHRAGGASVRSQMGPIREARLFTNSGTMIALDSWGQAGPFNILLFLDAIDYDYSMRLRTMGFKLFIAEDISIRHRQGRYVSRRFLGFKMNLRTYPPSRSYWIVRDTLLFASLWFRRYPREVISILLRQMSGTFGAMLLLDERRERGRLVLKAISDFGHRWDRAAGLAVHVPLRP